MIKAKDQLQLFIQEPCMYLERETDACVDLCHEINNCNMCIFYPDSEVQKSFLRHLEAMDDDN